MIFPPDGRKVLAVWKNWGQEKFEVDLPMTMRIEPIDPQNPQTVAVRFGSLVLFAIMDTQPLLARADLLAAKRMDQRSWQVNTAGVPIKILPFTDIGGRAIFDLHTRHVDINIALMVSAGRRGGI